MKKNFFHIGYQHCASTFLQKFIFPNTNFNNNIIKKDLEISKSRLPDNFGKFFFYQNNKIFSGFKNLKTPFIYTCEGFLQFIEHDEFYKKNKKKYLGQRVIAISNLIKYLLSNKNDEILVIIRKQSDLIQSIYSRKYKFFKNENQIFYDFPFKQISNKRTNRNIKVFDLEGYIYIDSLNYFLNLSIIANIIGKDRINILIYEELELNPKGFLKKLSKIFQVDMRHLEKYSTSKVNEKKK